MALTRQRRAYVVGARLLSGGPYMAYHLGRILQLDFGFQGVAVTVRGEPADNGIFHYDPVFPAVDIADMEASITDDDVLIANPSFSRFYFGMRCRGRKVMYVQDFKTFTLLDCGFDLYVSVSEVVRRFLAATWGIKTEVVPPFIQAANFPQAPSWRERPPSSVLVLLKGEPDHQAFMLERVRQLVSQRHPDVTLDVFIVGERRPQHELIEKMGRHRHFLSLTVAEGFGLMPLEAMAMGATVLGFDGLGGRDYMRPGINCAVSAYPDLEGVADRLAEMLEKPDHAELLAVAGHATATSRLYTIERFREDWGKQFAQLFREQ